MKRIITKYIITIVSLYGFSLLVHAETVESINNLNTFSNKKQAVCTVLQSKRIWYRSSDNGTSGEVTALQKFLVTKNYLKTEPSGYFGQATLAALKKYQADSGINQTGYIGDQTRAKIRTESCDQVTGVKTTKNDGVLTETKPDTKPNLGLPTIVKPKMCTMEARICADGSMMPRDENCGWHPEKCSSNPSSAAIDETIRRVPITLASSTPKACTLELKICSNGKPMLRNPDTCEWISSSCDQSGSGVRTILPSMITPPVKAVICTMEAKVCPNGTLMPRDENCGWHPEKCDQGQGEGMSCTKDVSTGQVICGSGGALQLQ
jgi:hypothetical protein